MLAQALAGGPGRRAPSPVRGHNSLMEHPYHLVHHVEQPPGGELYSKRWLGLLILCTAVLVSAFDMTVTNTALPSITKALGATTSDLQLIVDAYAIVLAGLLLLGGGLADRYGRKGVFMLGLTIFGLASALAAFSTESGQLIGARAVMGLGAALFLPPTLSILTVLFPKEERAKAVGVWAAFGGVGVALGPIIAGLLLSHFWWGSVFFVTVPCCAIAVVGAAFVIPTSRRPRTPSLDWTGGVLSIAGLATLLFGIIEGPDFGWTNPIVVAALVAGVVLIGAFVAWELHTPEPMFDVRVFGLRELVAGATALFLLYVTFVGLLFVLPQYLEGSLKESPLATGMLMAPVGIVFALCSPLSARVLKRLGVRTTLTVSMLVMGAGTLVIATLAWTTGVGLLVAGECIYGVGVALAMPPASTAVINALPVEKAGDGSDVNLITRQVGAAFGVALIGSVFAAASGHGIPGASATALIVAAVLAFAGALFAFVVLKPRAPRAATSS